MGNLKLQRNISLGVFATGLLLFIIDIWLNLFETFVVENVIMCAGIGMFGVYLFKQNRNLIRSHPVQAMKRAVILYLLLWMAYGIFLGMWFGSALNDMSYNDAVNDVSNLVAYTIKPLLLPFFWDIDKEPSFRYFWQDAIWIIFTYYGVFLLKTPPTAKQRKRATKKTTKTRTKRSINVTPESKRNTIGNISFLMVSVFYGWWYGLYLIHLHSFYY